MVERLPVQVPAGGNICQAPHVYTAAGVYTMRVTVKDADGGNDSRTLMVVVYYPGEGFVTGGGWIQSPPGAYAMEPLATGKALFGFVSRYRRDATQPTGAAVFHLQAGGFRFVSSSYDWLVVTGSKAQFVGRGIVNGKAGYDFVVTVTDGDTLGEDGVDKFRISVTGPEGLVYENSPEAGLDIDAVNPEAVSGGSIVIHH